MLFDVTEGPVVLPIKYNTSRGTKFKIDKMMARNLLENERVSGRFKVVKKISGEQKGRVKEILDGGHPKSTKIIDSPIHHIRFFYDDVYTLREGAWLNDRVIDFYLSMVQNEVLSDFNTIHMFPVFMMYHMTNGYTPKVGNKLFCEYSKVERWTRKMVGRLWEQRLVFYPVNIDESHWVLVCVETELRNTCYHHYIRFYDPAKYVSPVKRGMGNKYQIVVQQYMEVILEK